MRIARIAGSRALQEDRGEYEWCLMSNAHPLAEALTKLMRHAEHTRSDAARRPGWNLSNGRHEYSTTALTIAYISGTCQRGISRTRSTASHCSTASGPSPQNPPALDATHPARPREVRLGQLARLLLHIDDQTHKTRLADLRRANIFGKVGDTAAWSAIWHKRLETELLTYDPRCIDGRSSVESVTDEVIALSTSMLNLPPTLLNTELRSARRRRAPGRPVRLRMPQRTLCPTTGPLAISPRSSAR
jgi:hypothetical protein